MIGRVQVTRELWLAGIQADGAALRTAAGAPGALEAVVPSCPGWTVGHLIGHLGAVYQWISTHVVRGVIERPDNDAESVSRPAGGEALLTWWDEQHATIVAVMSGLDPDLPAWNPWPQVKKAAFWQRRMAHETAMHRWDTQLAVGLPEPIEPALATDGVAEVLDSWLPAGRRSGPTDLSGMVALSATDTGQNWYARLRGAGIALLDTDTIFDDSDHHERATATGTASDLNLALFGRVAFDVLDVRGEERLLEGLRVG